MDVDPPPQDIEATRSSNPMFLFSTRSDNKVLLEHLKAVPNGIRDVCKAHHITLHPDVAVFCQFLCEKLLWKVLFFVSRQVSQVLV